MSDMKMEEGRVIALNSMTEQKMKKIICKAALGLFATAFVLSGCGKTQKFKGGEDIGYPYSYEIKGNGKITLTLDGSATPDAKWEVIDTDDAIINVEPKKEEKAGKITYVITPEAEGNIDISFRRVTESDYGYVQGDDTNTWTIENKHVDDPDKFEELDEKHRSDMVSGDSTDEAEAEELPTPEEGVLSADELKLSASNVLCSYSMNVSITADGKKFSTMAVMAAGHLTKGVLSGEADEILDYEIWDDESGTIQIKLPIINGGWTYDSTGVYRETEHEEIPGIEYDEPEMDENGEYIIVDIGEKGLYDGDLCYVINGVGNGDATIVFTDMGEAYRFTVVLSVDEGRITLVSQKMERTE